MATRSSPNADAVVRALLDLLHSHLKTGLHLHDAKVHLDAPYYLYLTDEQACSYLSAAREPIYQDTLERPLQDILYKNRLAITAKTNASVHFYDLGPGYPNKSLILLEQLLYTTPSTRYFAIDISPYFLALTRKVISDRGIPVTTLNCLFEDAHKILLSYEPSDRPYTRFFFIGLTFNNYSIEHIIHILYTLCRAGDIVIIAAQFFDGLTPEAVTRPYKTPSAAHFNFLPLSLLGFNSLDFHYFLEFEDSCIRMGFRATSDIENSDLYVPKNTRIMTSFSYRYRKSYLNAHIEPFYCESVFGNDRPDIGVLKLRKQ